MPTSASPSEIVAKMISANELPATWRVEGQYVITGPDRRVRLPTVGKKAGWRKTVNPSLLPRSISSEHRRQLLHAVVQDLLRKGIVGKLGDSADANPLGALDPRLSALAKVHKNRVRRSDEKKERQLFFPVHVSVPLAFFSYDPTKKSGAQGPDAEEQGPKRQTDKGFRGPFVHFFSSASDGARSPEITDALRAILADTHGLSMLDRLLVAGLTKQLKEAWQGAVPDLEGLKPDSLESAAEPDGAEALWRSVFADGTTAENDEVFRPLPAFAEQGRRLARDLARVASSTALGRMSRIRAAESLLAYHFCLYLVRLVNVLHEELGSTAHKLSPGSPLPAWLSDSSLQIRFWDRYRGKTSECHEDYLATLTRLNEPYILLPVLNAAEAALRATASPDVDYRNVEWQTARTIELSGESRELASNILQVWAAIGSADCDFEVSPAERARDPLGVLYRVVRFHYTQPDQARYPYEHHGLVFEQAAQAGLGSFRQNRPERHFAIGLELLQMLAFVSFESSSQEKLPLSKFVSRLKQDLLVPADERALEALIESLRSLGLLERLSDVGEAHFLRAPASV